ncbi:hypothetical protein [Thalassococcus lentus]|uniref:Uncharacterized protein n=1 Tax=Thalassococcus lentus TaxID=1210524 RepID=A0ABT4XUV3_9RHOB|nr:hypothetical protein [Thalassococcus lentus]MDA7425630.1 hypothetical protein [Thalassococcus lentus]
MYPGIYCLQLIIEFMKHSAPQKICQVVSTDCDSLKVENKIIPKGQEKLNFLLDPRSMPGAPNKDSWIWQVEEFSLPPKFSSSQEEKYEFFEIDPKPTTENSFPIAFGAVIVSIPVGLITALIYIYVLDVSLMGVIIVYLVGTTSSIVAVFFIRFIFLFRSEKNADWLLAGPPVSLESFSFLRLGRLLLVLLHKSVERQTSPFPGRAYPTGSVTGMPRAA